MKKICFVIQRYGLEVNGGAETLCRELAERMCGRYDVEVLTTRAIDYMTWKDEYKSDEEIISGVKVRRFSVKKERHRKAFNAINRVFKMGLLPEFMEYRWLVEQGPYTPELIDYIRRNKDAYDVFIFVTYLYYPTVLGVSEVADKAIVLPLAHDEPFLRMKIFNPVFTSPRAFLFETEEERDLARSRFECTHIPYHLGGSGVEIPSAVCAEDFKTKYGLDNYIIYAGRIDDGKNCPELFEFFLRYKKENGGNLKLVLLGKSVIDIPDSEDIVSLGFVSEKDKFDGMAGAKLLVMPSKYESLSIVVLEAFSLGVPVLVNGECAVLKGHCDKSGGGLYYTSYDEFQAGLKKLVGDEKLMASMGQRGNVYVSERFNWNKICDNLAELIEMVAG
ncbi:glycosyltransferase family 4 protein [Butyrivibrio sp. FC2001]|uniref:glycosyltransferase family 4 protein n=1 Tax=Butyrivibrio sp. FC2001 TaxID=1280671 RepID=UPI000418144D|nr:glycosyltransferase family 4 protein [Butyrivibrio sp. FC2001]